MKFFWYWLACVMQRRQEKRVAQAERATNQLIIDADPDYARLLGILPPMPITREWLADLTDSCGRPPHYSEMYGSALFSAGYSPEIAQMLQQTPRRNDQLLQMLGGIGLGLGGPAGLAVGSALGGLLGAGRIREL